MSRISWIKPRKREKLGETPKKYTTDTTPLAPRFELWIKLVVAHTLTDCLNGWTSYLVVKCKDN